MKKNVKLMIAMVLVLALTACSSKSTDVSKDSVDSVKEKATNSSEEAAKDTSSQASGPYFNEGDSVEDIILKAAGEGKVGNWGLGNEYEVQALLTKYGQSISYLSQAFDMDGFDDDSILLASAMTYNELGLVKNSYDGGYGYGDSVAYIDMNDEGVDMLEDNLFTTKKFAEENPNTVKAFI